MTDRNSSTARIDPTARPIGNALALVAALVVLAAWIVRGPSTAEPDVAGPTVLEPEVPDPAVAVAEAAVPPPPPEPEPISEPEPDAAPLIAAERDLAKSEAALDAEAKQAERIAEQRREAELKALAARRDAEEALRRSRRQRERLEGVHADLSAFDADRVRFDQDIEAIRAAPHPREALNTSRSPVARTIVGSESHFEVRGDRVAFINLDRLLELAQDDARLRIRMSSPSRSVEGTVGPVGPFQLSYEVGPTSIGMASDLMGRSGISASYTLLGFEVTSPSRMRGETIDVALTPASEVGRALHRLDPSRSTITLWVYPDGFALYRRLWDALHRAGFTVAARPMPAGMPIRGGPNGSRSSGQ